MRIKAIPHYDWMSNSPLTICTLMLLLLFFPFKVFAEGKTTRVSVSSNGVQGNGYSIVASISSDGRYVAFESYADNLVNGDTNGVDDVFVHDRQSGQTTRVSVSSTGAQGNSVSGNWSNSISPDGRHVVFFSNADNLVDDDTNGWGDVFVHDRQSGQTTRVSVSSNGVQGNGYSGNWSSISSDGRYVAFESYADNLVNGDTNGWDDVFVHDRQTGQTTRVSVSSNGVQGNGYSGWPSISSDGRYVAFHSDADNLVDSDTNGTNTDVFVHDRQTGQTTLVSVSSTGVQGTIGSQVPSISSDGRYVAFQSWADNLVDGDTNGWDDVFVHDRQTGLTTRVSVSSNGVQGNGYNGWPSISSDGQYVAFQSDADNLVDGDTNGVEDVFVHDRQTGQTTRVSVSSYDVQGNGYSGVWSSISSDGRYVAFQSYADNLVNSDTNGVDDIFVHDRLSEPAEHSLPHVLLLLLND